MAGFTENVPNPDYKESSNTKTMAKMEEQFEDIQTSEQIILTEDLLNLDDQLNVRDSIDYEDPINEAIKKFKGDLEEIDKVQNDEYEEERDKIEQVSKKEALVSLQKLEHYALQNSFDFDHIKRIESLRSQMM
ncbi:MAG: hypothetical protein MHPSP_004900 [Paramarteilia canceri]